MSRLAAFMTLAVLLSAGLAGEPSDPVKPAPPDLTDGGKPAAPAKSMARLHPVIVRLGLGDEQLGKIDELLGEQRKKFFEALKELQADGKLADAARLQDRQKELRAECGKRIRDMLTAELQPKFDAGMKSLDESEARKLKLQESLVAALQEAAGDQEKMQKAQKELAEKAKALRTELDRELDEKVGKLPEPAKPGK